MFQCQELLEPLAKLVVECDILLLLSKKVLGMLT